MSQEEGARKYGSPVVVFFFTRTRVEVSEAGLQKLEIEISVF